MTQRLRKVVFCEILLPLVKDFHCGDEFWDREVSDWIKTPSLALKDMRRKRPCSVWLHINDDDSIVGFSSLCESNWEGYPKLSIIPNVAVATEFQGTVTSGKSWSIASIGLLPHTTTRTGLGCSACLFIHKM